MTQSDVRWILLKKSEKRKILTMTQKNEHEMRVRKRVGMKRNTLEEKKAICWRVDLAEAKHRHWLSGE